ncbi:hypothetical protein DL771_002915 [Monosporascus sp. 5C6A]|nr:hypothetical protein DL771_002915 [Monosporascus sp. 5C6A]
MVMATNPPPPSASSSSPRSIQRKPLHDLPPQRRGSAYTQDDGEMQPSVTEAAETAVYRAAPVSPVRMNFHPENWVQPSNATIMEGQEAETQSHPTPHRPMYVPASSAGEQPAIQPTRPTFSAYIPYRPGPEEAPYSASSQLSPETVRAGSNGFVNQSGRAAGDISQGQDPNRRSRESDTTSSTQQQTSAESSTDTSASSISGGRNDVCDSRDSIIEETIPEGQSVPQLQYHHQPLLPRVASVPPETHSRNSSSTDLTEGGLAPNRHLTPNSSYGRRVSLARPHSSYSVSSDFSPRGRSPGALSRKSPETRPTSYAELLNVPYPQPAPAPITLDNNHLRGNVGNNASLLSAQQTLEMYRQNVKKTNDFSIQYSFAVFLISYAQEQGLTFHELSQKKPGSKPGTPSNEGVESSPAALVREAKSILTRLANGGYPFAQYYLADGYASGLFNKGKEDYHAAFPLFILAGKHGHAESAYRAGLCYEFGWGCRKDPAKAVQYLRTAASKNHPGAMTRLGKACLSGDLGENRYREGVKWLKRATEAADTIYNAAPYHLGLLYEIGYGEDVFKDESYAAELFTQAAELGHAEAGFRMGEAYEHERGHAGAMMGLCAWYMVGAEPVLEKDEEEAYEWARRAADLGLVKAQYAVGYFTEMGIGCRRDILEANVWYVKAADSGDERAKQRLAAIRAAVSGGTPMEVAPPRSGKVRKNQTKDDKECVVM